MNNSTNVDAPKRTRGRPKLAQPPRVYYIKVRLYLGQDDATIALLDQVEPREMAGYVAFVLREQAARELQEV